MPRVWSLWRGITGESLARGCRLVLREVACRWVSGGSGLRAECKR